MEKLIRLYPLNASLSCQPSRLVRFDFFGTSNPEQGSSVPSLSENPFTSWSKKLDGAIRSAKETYDTAAAAVDRAVDAPRDAAKAVAAYEQHLEDTVKNTAQGAIDTVQYNAGYRTRQAQSAVGGVYDKAQAWSGEKAASARKTVTKTVETARSKGNQLVTEAETAVVGVAVEGQARVTQTREEWLAGSKAGKAVEGAQKKAGDTLYRGVTAVEGVRTQANAGIDRAQKTAAAAVDDLQAQATRYAEGLQAIAGNFSAGAQEGVGGAVDTLQNAGEKVVEANHTVRRLAVEGMTDVAYLSIDGGRRARQVMVQKATDKALGAIAAVAPAEEMVSVTAKVASNMGEDLVASFRDELRKMEDEYDERAEVVREQAKNKVDVAKNDATN